MTNKKKQARCRELTMGCWWPTRYYPKPKPRWDRIASELRLLAEYPGAPKNIQELIEYSEGKERGKWDGLH